MASDPADEGGPTVADRPDRTGEATVPLAGAPAPAPLALVAAGMAHQSIPGSLSITNAVDAMRDEEVERTRLFLAMGWLISLVSVVAACFVDAPRVLIEVFIVGLVVGVIVSYTAWRRLANPANYTERALVLLAVIAAFNSHVAILFFGTFTARR